MTKNPHRLRECANLPESRAPAVQMGGEPWLLADSPKASLKYSILPGPSYGSQRHSQLHSTAKFPASKDFQEVTASGPRPTVPVSEEGLPSGPFSTLAWNHWLDEVRRSYRDCHIWPSCPNQAQQEEVAQDCVQSVFKYLHRWRPHKLSVKPIPVFDHPIAIIGTRLTCGDIQPSPNLICSPCIRN